MVFLRKMFLKISKNLLENTRVAVSFLVKCVKESLAHVFPVNFAKFL